MSILLSDPEIQALLAERKPLPANYAQKMILKPKRGHGEWELTVHGVSGNAFCLIARKSVLNPLDFSVILAYDPRGTNKRFRLRRYNGKSHEHANALEAGPLFYDFHVHTATERYQRANFAEDHWAEVTSRYGDVRSALDCMIADCGFELPGGGSPLFPTL